jgi:hypothetical protein
MAANDSHSLRMLIQQIGLEPAYRMAVYGDLEKPRHADFNTGQILLETLQLHCLTSIRPAFHLTRYRKAKVPLCSPEKSC